MRCLFLYNPVSGRGKISKKLDKIVRALEKKYDEVDTYATKCRGDMMLAAANAAEKYDALIFSGGDGSFNEVVQGVAGASRVPELGYIPCGTVNDIAHSLGIPKRLSRALKVILTGDSVLLDCMKINDCYAMYIVAAGAFTSATYSAPQDLKHHIGRIAYGVEGLRKKRTEKSKPPLYANAKSRIFYSGCAPIFRWRACSSSGTACGRKISSASRVLTLKSTPAIRSYGISTAKRAYRARSSSTSSRKKS